MAGESRKHASVGNVGALLKDGGFLKTLRSRMGLGGALGVLQPENGGTGRTSFAEAFEEQYAPQRPTRRIECTEIMPSEFKDSSIASFEDSAAISVGDGAFNKCSAKKIMLWNARTINKSAFFGCEAELIHIPKVERIPGDWPFFGCKKLKTIWLPKTLTEFYASQYRYPFDQCNALTIYMEASSAPSGWYSGWNYNDTAKKPIPTVYGVTLDEYKTIAGI